MTKLFPFARVLTVGSVGVAITLCVCLQAQTSVQLPGATTPASSPRRLVDRYCVPCHNERLKIADLRLDRIDIENPGAEAPGLHLSLGKNHERIALQMEPWTFRSGGCLCAANRSCPH